MFISSLPTDFSRTVCRTFSASVADVIPNLPLAVQEIVLSSNLLSKLDPSILVLLLWFLRVNCWLDGSSPLHLGIVQKHLVWLFWIRQINSSKYSVIRSPCLMSLVVNCLYFDSWWSIGKKARSRTSYILVMSQVLSALSTTSSTLRVVLPSRLMYSSTPALWSSQCNILWWMFH